MFDRKIEQDLLQWKTKPGRKPLIFRGARQTGKTTLVRRLGHTFSSVIELNLEKDPLRKIFSEVKDAKEVVQSIEGMTNQRVTPGQTLLFLDEIQQCGAAIKMLRYFYEELPALHVIGAGSLLEVRMKREGWAFPVGRVEFLYLYPVTFEEFLSATGQDILRTTLSECAMGTALPAPLHAQVLDALSVYMIVGGMPEAVQEFTQSGSFLAVQQCHETLTASFKEDFAKYAGGAQSDHLQLSWDRLPFEMGRRIAYSRLGGTQARSQEISKAFDILHDAMLVERILPTTQTAPPLVPKVKAAPKALFLDVGLCATALCLTKDQVREQLLDPTYHGGLHEVFVGQELLAADFSSRHQLYFWIREEKGTSSELDYLVPMDRHLVPIEVKSGSHGSLKSLHQFLSRSGISRGVRLYTDAALKHERHVVTLPTGDSLTYQLLSLPLYLAFRLHQLLRDAP